MWYAGGTARVDKLKTLSGETFGNPCADDPTTDDTMIEDRGSRIDLASDNPSMLTVMHQSNYVIEG